MRFSASETLRLMVLNLFEVMLLVLRLIFEIFCFSGENQSLQIMFGDGGFLNHCREKKMRSTHSRMLRVSASLSAIVQSQICSKEDSEREARLKELRKLTFV